MSALLPQLVMPFRGGFEADNDFHQRNIIELENWARHVLGQNITMTKDSDQSVTSTTYADVTGFSFPINASETWVAVLYLQVLFDGTSDWKDTWTVPSGATGTRGGLSITPGNSTGWRATSLTGDHIEGSASTGDGFMMQTLRVANSTTAGTMQFRFAFNSAGGTANSIYAGSWGTAWRVA